METLIMGSSSSSSYLKLVSCKHNNMGFSISPLHHFGHNHNNKDVGFKLSISVYSSTCRSVCPVSCSSSHTQAEFKNHELLVQESLNGHTIETQTETETVRVKFQLHRECSFGQNFLITGDDQVLGLWDPNNAIPLTWSEGHLWSADLDIPIGKCIKFKFIMQESDGVIVWQPGPDRVLECFKTDKMMTLCEDWEDPDSRTIIETEPTVDQEIQMVETSGETLVEPLVGVNGTEEPKGYATNMKQILVSDEGVPVLVPGLSQYQEDSVNVASNDEPEPINGSAMVSTEPDMVKDSVNVASNDEPEPLNGSAMVSTEPDMVKDSVNVASNDEPEPLNGCAMVSTEPDMAEDLILPKLDLKGDADTSDSNPTPEISSIHENQDSSENEHQEIQQVAEEQDQQVTQPMEHFRPTDVKWGHNIVQKLLSIFNIQ